MKITFNLTSSLVALVIALPAYSQGVVPTAAIAQEELVKIDAFLADTLKNVSVVKTTATAAGETISPTIKRELPV